ncbi:MAG: hypothetical protein IJF59_06080 [Clostridia bacterium]|nr:hypothetical protein [Clostridia bacterium]
MNYGDDAETAALLSGVSGEADRLQSFTTLTKNLVMGGNNQKAYAYYKDKHAGMIDEDAGYKKVMEDAQDIIGFSYGKSDWLKENPELVDIAREQASERQDADVASWNQARKAMAAPAEPEKKKHRFRRWLNK